VEYVEQLLESGMTNVWMFFSGAIYIYFRVGGYSEGPLSFFDRFLHIQNRHYRVDVLFRFLGVRMIVH
jgi:hypothetical protein